MATPAKTRKSPARSASGRGNSNAASAPAARTRQQRSSGSAKGASATSSNHNRAGMAKTALRALVGTAALGYAGREALKHARRPRLLGVSLPRDLKPGKLDVKKLAKQVGTAADRLERVSEDVRMASAQAKRMSKKLS